MISLECVHENEYFLSYQVINYLHRIFAVTIYQYFEVNSVQTESLRSPRSLLLVKNQW